MTISNRNQSAKPLVSIAMATFNGERYLKEQLDSLLAQDYPNLEIIISDDGSCDSSIDILEQYEREHSHITLLKNSVNLGYIKNFENAIKHTIGDLVALCDQDDVWAENKISAQVAELKTTNASGIYTNAHLVDSKNRIINGTDLWSAVNKRLPLEHLPPEAFYLNNCVTGCTFLLQRDIAAGAMPFPADVPHDWWLAYHCAYNDGIYGLNKHLVRYRQHSKNVLGLSESLKHERLEFYFRDRLQKMTLDFHFNKALKAEKETAARLAAMDEFENKLQNKKNNLLKALRSWSHEALQEKPLDKYHYIFQQNHDIFILAERPKKLTSQMDYKKRKWRFRKRVIRRYISLITILLVFGLFISLLFK